MKKFTPEEDQFLRDNYLTIPAKRMADMLGRCKGTARQRMKLLGIVTPREVIESYRKASQIKPGNIPQNKGRKMSEWMSKEGIKASKATRFKKGGLPHNTKQDGCIRIRKDKSGWEYQYIRIALAKWVPLQRWVYEQVNGKIAKGMIVRFRDHNTGNCNIENLELITQKENMLRNTVHNYPKEIALIVQLRGALNRQINKYEKQNKRPA